MAPAPSIRSDLKIEQVDIKDVSAYAANARTHSPAQVSQIASSMRAFGFVNPVLIDSEGVLIAGHGRVLAARQLGMRTVPAIRVGYLSEDEARALRLADNKIALNSGWDEDLLRQELEVLREQDFDLDLTGFSLDEVDALLAESGLVEGETPADEVPELRPDSVVTLSGDIWLLGKHRLVCGDSTDADTVERCLAGVKPHLMVTDPPYGVDYDPEWRDEAGEKGHMRRRTNNRTAKGKVKNDGKADWREAWALFPGDVAYVWSAGLQARPVIESIEAVDFEIRSQIVWAKSHFAIGRGHYHFQHENCWYAVRKGRTGHWCGDRKQTTVWNIPLPSRSETGHSTQKPVECMRRPMENNSNPGQVVYEPFSGSGTTIIAGEQSGRAVYAIEINPAYVDLAVRRWQDFSGEEAIHELTGKSFDDLAGERSGGPAVESVSGGAEA